MAEQTSSSLIVDAPPGRVMAVVADFESYPLWAKGVKRTAILGMGPDGRASKVFFELDASPIKDEYTLRYDWDDDRIVRWQLVEGQMLTAMDGAYELEGRADGTTHVTYRLAVAIRIPLIGMLKRKAEKVIIDTALSGLKRRVEGTA